jgi:hypothetical protein
MNWLSFMINKKIIIDKKIIDHIRPDMTRYYEETFLKTTQLDERDSRFYQEFTKLYRMIKI